jgi:hypothetical protein
MSSFFQKLKTNLSERIADFKDRGGPGGRHPGVFTALGTMGAYCAGVGAALLGMSAFYALCGVPGFFVLLAAGAILGGVGGEDDDFAKIGLLATLAPGAVAGGAAFTAVAAVGIVADAVLGTAIKSLLKKEPDLAPQVESPAPRVVRPAQPEVAYMRDASARSAFPRTYTKLGQHFNRATRDTSYLMNFSEQARLQRKAAPEYGR